MRINKRSFLSRLTPTQFIVLGYLCAIGLISVLLWLPISHKQGVALSYLDALFTATSGVTVTGLTVTNTVDTFNVFGHLVLLASFQIGGIGIMALGTFLWLLLGKQIGLNYRRMIMIDQNQNHLSGLVTIIRILIGLTILIELIGATIFSVYFYVRGLEPNLLDAVYMGIFHAISAYTNAGFDLFGNSLTQYVDDVFVQVVTMLLIVLGALGLPVFVELREYFFGKQPNFRFSLFTKMTSSLFFLLLIVGAGAIWLAEKDLFFHNLSTGQKWLHAFFYSVTSRSAGLTTMDVSEFSIATQYILSMLMFVGASPSSMGGGVRTTTVAVILLTLLSYAAGKNEVRAFRRSLKQEDITKSFVVFTAAIILVVACILVINIFEPHIPLIAILFEVTSAFGTSGLSMGITDHLSAYSKFTLMMLMFIGRISVLSLLFIFQQRKWKGNVRYPSESIIIG